MVKPKNLRQLEKLLQIKGKWLNLVEIHKNRDEVEKKLQLPAMQAKTSNKTSQEEILKSLMGSVIKYVDPNKPVGMEDWEALK